jgi:uncharacterized protein (DUF934 family)
MKFLDASTPALPTLDAWRAAPEPKPAGVLLPNDVDVATLQSELPQLQTIALQFPKWTDGRAYTQAHLLRARYRFDGELRAVDQVLVDMLPLMQRTGFTSAVLRADQKLNAARRALDFFPAHYQGDLNEPRPWFARRAA